METGGKATQGAKAKNQGVCILHEGSGTMPMTLVMKDSPKNGILIVKNAFKDALY